MTLADLQAARDTLGLGREATWQEIRLNYRALAQKHHPDRNPDQDKSTCEEKMRALNEAYALIDAYCRNYRFGFDDETLQRMADQQNWWFARFSPPGTR